MLIHYSNQFINNPPNTYIIMYVNESQPPA